MDNIEYTLNQPFDVERHKKAFIGQLDVIIDEDGTVHYVVPSRVTWLVHKYCEQMNIPKKEYVKRLIIDREENIPADVHELCEATKCIAVWYDFIVGVPNEQQTRTLEFLRRHEVYRGEIYECDRKPEERNKGNGQGKDA